MFALAGIVSVLAVTLSQRAFQSLTMRKASPEATGFLYQSLYELHQFRNHLGSGRPFTCHACSTHLL